MLVNGKKLLLDALQNGYAVGAYNFSNMEQLKAIINASEKRNASVIVQASKSAIEYMGIDMCVAMVKSEAERVSIPVCLNLDHGANFEICKLCIDKGFTNVMIDASALEYEENIKLTKQVVEYAHKHNVTVEAELGSLKGVEDEVMSVSSHFTDPNQAKDFVERTGIDSLAVSIGTSHGAYKFKGESKLDIERLAQIRDIVKIPLVLHGASSLPQHLLDDFAKTGGDLKSAKGVSTENLKDAVKNGICKVNMDTDLRIAFTTAIRETITPQMFSPRDYLKVAIKRTENLVDEKIDILGTKKYN